MLNTAQLMKDSTKCLSFQQIKLFLEVKGWIVFFDESPWRSVCGTWNVNLTRFNVLCNEKSPQGEMFSAADMPEDNGVPAYNLCFFRRI